MKQKTKKIIYKILKIFWIIIGIIIAVWDIYWFIRVKIMNDYGFVINAVLFTIGVFLLVAYIIITLFFKLIKLLKKKSK